MPQTRMRRGWEPRALALERGEGLRSGEGGKGAQLPREQHRERRLPFRLLSGARGSIAAYASNGAKMHEELCPPKPNELEMAAVILRSCLTFGTVLMPSTSSISLSWLSVGCTCPVWMALTAATASRPAAAPRQCPMSDLVPLIFMCLKSSGEKTLRSALTSAMSPTSVLQAGAERTQRGH
eukprot:366082-Chlamydomonas_euryale.AAC.7